ncbi:hypothetical protein Dimus_016761 [Dionaea muscipula]
MAAIGVPASTPLPNSAATEANTAVSSAHPLRRRHFKVSFPVSPRPKLRFFSKGIHYLSNQNIAAKAKLNKALGGSSDSAAIPIDKSEASPAEIKKDERTSESSSPALASKESINEFLSQVASIVKLVDSRDIVELQLKQLDCELLIRKKEAISLPPSPAPVVMQPSPPTVNHYVASPAPAPAPAPAPTVASAPSSTAAVTQPSKSSLPPLKCPMSWTFYRSPAPGEPPFVKVGDKVQKGQVLCIVEAMKLMNEIEADQSGTIVEILAEDAKPIGIDQPLLVIQP